LHRFVTLLKTSEAECRAVMVAFDSMIEHDVEDYLDVYTVQRLDHVAELIHRAERVITRYTPVGREVRDRCIDPVVDLPRRAVLGIEL
jgi:hypothetical protein